MPVEKVTLGREHKVVSWLIEGLMALTWVDRQLSPDALAKAVGLLTAFRIYTAQRRQSSTHARIAPIRLPTGTVTGIPIADLRHGCCWKLVVMDEVKSCHSCSTRLPTNEVGSVFTKAAPSTHTNKNHCYFGARFADCLCGSCHNQFFAPTVFCQHCNAPSHSDFLVFLGHHSSLVPSNESLIREVFQEEIRECES